MIFDQLRGFCQGMYEQVGKAKDRGLWEQRLRTSTNRQVYGLTQYSREKFGEKFASTGVVKMGLAERRAVKAFQDNKYPKLKEEIDAAAGFEVSIEVKWDTLATENYAELYEEAFPKVYFRPLIDAIKGVCIDELGKEALKNGLKKIVIADEGRSEVTFQFGTLSISYYAVSNLDYGADRKAEIQKVLEKGL